MEKEADGSIRHYLRRPLPDAGAPIKGVLDWPRRFDHMQQHAGQHILSAAFAETFGIQTAAFHMGKNISTIDLGTSSLEDETAAKAEQTANRMVFKDQPIIAKRVEKAELDRYPLRKPPTVSENIRLVIIEGFDYNPCARGTHPARTGEVGPIKIIGWTRDRGHIRLEFVCGWRALALMSKEHRDIRQLTSLLQTHADDLCSRVEKRLEDCHTLEQDLRRLKEQVLAFEADSLAAQGETDGGLAVIARVFDERPMKECRKLAALIIEHHPRCVVLFVIKSGSHLQVTCARGEDVAIDMNALVKQSLPRINGKGGGSPNAAQGAGEAKISAEDMIGYLKKALAEISES
ncbi:DHHA1 domain-containing protein [Terrilactibacillus sp. S3-3]|nr:DHHA1 domain-containing protein [Terrilactibacillus sp. S3-3]